VTRRAHLPGDDLKVQVVLIKTGVGALVGKVRPLLTVVHDTHSSNEDAGAVRSLLDEIVRDGARQMLAAALRAEVAAGGPPTPPLSPDEHAAEVEEERAALAGDAQQRPFFQLVYNERCAPATEWFDQRGWTAVGTALTDYLRPVGRPVPGPEPEAGPMIARNTNLG
jgi:hypothetical protein